MKKILLSVFVVLIFLVSCRNQESNKDNEEFLLSTNLQLPLDNDLRVSLTPKFSWKGKLTSNPDDLVFDFYIGIERTLSTPEATNLKVLSHTIKKDLKPLTRYYWKIVSRIKTQSSESRIFTFKTAPPKSVPVEAVEILGRDVITLKKGLSSVLGVSISPDNASLKTIRWKSEDPKIITVTTEGVITGISRGTTTITAESADGLFSDTITVTVEDNSVEISEISIKGFLPKSSIHELEIGEVYELNVEVSPKNAVNKITKWTTKVVGKDGKADEIATVRLGKIQGHKLGVITVTVYSVRNPSIKDQRTFKIILKSLPSGDVLSQGTFKKNKYYIIKRTFKWGEASNYAKTYGGHLVHIESDDEQRFLQQMILDVSRKSGNLSPKISINDGGGIQFFWIGATDKYKEGDWVWNGDNNPNNTQKIGTSSIDSSGNTTWVSAKDKGSDVYQNWGKKDTGSLPSKQIQPNQYKGADQDYGAISLNNWDNATSASGGSTIEKYGEQYQWNDLVSNTTTASYFIIEIENGASQ